jgi:hypothetical protein
VADMAFETEECLLFSAFSYYFGDQVKEIRCLQQRGVFLPKLSDAGEISV